MRLRTIWLGEHAVRLTPELELAPGSIRSDTDVRDRLYAQLVAHLARHCEDAGAISDVVVGWNAVTVHLAPSSRVALAPPLVQDEWLRRLVAALDADPVERTIAPQTHTLDLCFGALCAPDLPEVAARAGWTVNETARRYAAGRYTVRMIGFAPGFLYLDGLDGHLFAPRRETPRTHVEPGSVGIAGAQTGIYSLRTPGGWQIIGRTSATLFDPAVDPPAPFAVADRVRFAPTLCARCSDSKRVKDESGRH